MPRTCVNSSSDLSALWVHMFSPNSKPDFDRGDFVMDLVSAHKIPLKLSLDLSSDRHYLSDTAVGILKRKRESRDSCLREAELTFKLALQ